MRLSLLQAVVVQRNVISALILRELHTRFGRDNVGFLWLILEPSLLAVGVSAFHLFTHSDLKDGLSVVPFYVSGYMGYMLFRSNIGRATTAIEANKGLMHHRRVTLTDIVISRCTLELMSVTCALLMLLMLCSALGLGGGLPRPIYLFLGLGLMFWLTTALAMIVCGASELSVVFERLVHPFTYLMLPISGMFFRPTWAPEPFRAALEWVPMAQIIDIIRAGVFLQIDRPVANYPYLIAWCALATLGGLLTLRATRVRMHLS